MTKEDKEAIVRRLEAMYGEAEDNETKEALFYATEALREQRPHSEWLQVTDWDGRILAYKCKTCGWYKPHNVLPFCENCGADMRKEGEAE